MNRLVRRYADKLVSAGLAGPGAPIVGGLDDVLVWNRQAPELDVLEQVFAGLNINSLVFSRPSEPYASIIDFLARNAGGTIRPSDCETRTFLHDLPVVREFEPAPIIETLKRRKCAVIPGHGIIAFGTVSPEQGFVTFSSVCFASFVNFFSEYLEAHKANRVSPEFREAFQRIVPLLDPPFSGEPPRLMRGPFASPDEVVGAMCEAGRATVSHHLVDSYFGNISYLHGDVLYISQTGSSLDEMEGCIDPCPLDGSTSAGLTASSELTAHMEIVKNTPNRAILHGHPKFSVILSMDCDDKAGCPNRDACHIKCSRKRLLDDIPIVPGEVGTGPRGLCNTLPPAMEGRRGVIVHGHGLFTVAEHDFNIAFANLLQVETFCQMEYFRRISHAEIP